MHRLVRLLAMCALLAGCASEAVRLPGDWNDHIAALAERPTWELQGKIGARSGREGGSALLSWRQDQARYRLVLSGALGLGKLVLDGSPDGVSWTGRDGRTRSHPDPAALVRELWGWDLPVASLTWWARGLPDPSQALDRPRFENGLASRFEQSGWTISIDGYRSVDGIPMPSRVRLEGTGAVVTVSISRWSFTAP